MGMMMLRETIMNARAVLLFFLVLLSGCAYSTSLYFVNGTSRPIEVVVTEIGGARSASQQVAPGAGWASHTPENGQGWNVRVTIDSCVLTYAVPSTNAGLPYSVELARRSPLDASYIRLRIGEDRRIALLAPSSEGAAQLLNAQDLSVLGFPLAATQQSCS
jgi:hypothetical protein